MHVPVSYVFPAEMVPVLRRHLESAAVRDQVDPMVRRVNRLCEAAIEAQDYELAVWSWLMALLMLHGRSHGTALAAALQSPCVHRLVAAAVQAHEPPTPAGEEVAGG